MIDSFDRWEAAGFKLVRARDNKLMVAKHKSAKGFLFKKYNNNIHPARQLTKYERRVTGAHTIKALIEMHGLRRVVVPKKWLVRLPDMFSSGTDAGYIVIVEEMPIVETDKSKKLYRRIDKRTLRELCLIFYMCKELDFRAQNMPFTKRGKIAFVDTGYLALRNIQQREDEATYFHLVEKYLSDKRIRLANEIWHELRSSPPKQPHPSSIENPVAPLSG